MNKSVIIGFFTVLVISSLIVAGMLGVDPTNDKEAIGKLYTFSISVGEKIYEVTVRSNYSSAPKIRYWEIGKAVFVDFWGSQENSFCNITIPTELIWGELCNFQDLRSF